MSIALNEGIAGRLDEVAGAPTAALSLVCEMPGDVEELVAVMTPADFMGVGQDNNSVNKPPLANRQPHFAKPRRVTRQCPCDKTRVWNYPFKSLIAT